MEAVTVLDPAAVLGIGKPYAVRAALGRGEEEAGVRLVRPQPGPLVVNIVTARDHPAFGIDELQQRIEGGVQTAGDHFDHHGDASRGRKRESVDVGGRLDLTVDNDGQGQRLGGV